VITMRSSAVQPKIADSHLLGIGARLAETRGAMSREKFAALLGLHRNTIIRYEQELAYPDAAQIAMLCERFDISESWLLRGRGLKDVAKPITVDDQLIGDDQEIFVSIPLINDNQRSDVAPVALKRSWLHLISANQRDLFAFVVDDDAMEPALSRGDLVVADSQNDGVVRDAIYILEINHRTTVRRLQLLPDGQVRIKCDNQHYESHTAKSAESLNINGVAIGMVCIL